MPGDGFDYETHYIISDWAPKPQPSPQLHAHSHRLCTPTRYPRSKQTNKQPTLYIYGARSDMGQVDSALGGPGSSKKSKKWTHKGTGALVFVECHTGSRGKPRLGPGRPLKLWGSCVDCLSGNI
ncbi:hypothetical protein DPEC_G00294370 [Dallia pectoralis]|uniref:Uncharacterized protein n=1 Tax=Dallia pectoralis TaxID=75939 RepID=A0ACC2FIV3_DALPE|nr:hypothetical protein DPEC_G00294370 [Dallia pectoralis]